MVTEKRLGKGLSALLGESAAAPSGAPPAATPSAPPSAKGEVAPTNRLLEVPLDAIKPSRVQPRTDFNDADLAELAQSIKREGVLQPILVRSLGDGTYELVAGERRLRASKLAEINKISVLVIDNIDDKKQLILALIENLQRKDLNAIEKARAFKLLAERMRLTQEELAAAVGLDRATIANVLRLLDLAPEIQEAVAKGVITATHARMLAGVGNKAQQFALLREIVEKDISVKQLGERIRALLKGHVTKKAAHGSRESEPPADEVHYKELADSLTHLFGTKIKITKDKKGRGKISISFYSTKQLDELIRRLGLYGDVEK